MAIGQAIAMPAARTQAEPAGDHAARPAGDEAASATLPAAAAPAVFSAADAPPLAAHPLQAGDIAVTVHFRFGESRLTPAARTLLDEAARQASDAGPFHRLRIVGRTDSLGPQAFNDALAIARARAVRDHLRTRLARWPAAVDVEAAGACCYAARNDTADGRLANRRVEVGLSASDPEAAP
ncbi:OmpA family protein [Delftia sp. Cs1-4]|uniref:OmpA family protein n=1 Tax=Delftia sp. (strain Cs1-4) TaxID=742013 RepID=UPI0012F4D9F7|nr:OmpA family protein [Delftia sp. Cs1-4]